MVKYITAIFLIILITQNGALCESTSSSTGSTSISSSSVSNPPKAAPQTPKVVQQPPKNVPPQPFEMPPVSNATVTGFSNFARDLYEWIIPGRQRNIIVSPLSVQTCLALLSCGARGETHKDIINGLKWTGLSQAQLITDFKKLLYPLQKSSTVSMANAIYVGSSFKINPKFQEIGQIDFYSKVDSVDFSKNIAAANTINNWVANETHNKISDLVKSSDFDVTTAMVLTNALYFEQKWKQQFSKINTHLGSWSQNCKDENSNWRTGVAMMQNIGSYKSGYIQKLDANVLQIPFSSSDIAMTILLPSKCGQLPQLEQALKDYDLLSITSQLKEERLIIKIPKFEFDYNINLNAVLEKMGMKIMYGRNADFGGLFTTKLPVSVSQVQTKATIAVSEEGVIATAATFTKFSYHRGLPRYKRYTADRPFIFLLHSPQEVLFIGRVWQPVIMKF